MIDSGYVYALASNLSNFKEFASGIKFVENLAINFLNKCQWKMPSMLFNWLLSAGLNDLLLDNTSRLSEDQLDHLKKFDISGPTRNRT